MQPTHRTPPHPEGKFHGTLAMANGDVGCKRPIRICDVSVPYECIHLLLPKVERVREGGRDGRITSIETIVHIYIYIPINRYPPPWLYVLCMHSTAITSSPIYFQTEDHVLFLAHFAIFIILNLASLLHTKNPRPPALSIFVHLQYHKIVQFD